ncbi:MAG: hypothetical protein JOZ13_07270 [Alphaproteobacteria bacterium]|nr:hypothetical protein [Alphaproteobacteria bacterium]
MLVIPVNITGSGATAENIAAIVDRDNTLNLGGSTVTIQVIATDKPINGVLNHMDFSPTYNNSMCGDAGECVNRLGGNEAHINSANDQSTDAAAHDILHFAGIDDQYTEGPRDPKGNRTSKPKPGYDNTNIMTSRSGTNLKPGQVNEAQGNPTTKKCVVKTGSRIPTCK